MMIIMSMNKHFLFAFILSFMVLNHVQGSADEEFTSEQYEGRWYDMGRISTCYDDLATSCVMYDVDRPYGGDDFRQSRIPIVDIPMCEYGFPIYNSYVQGTFSNSEINVRGNSNNPALSSFIKSYNNGGELILTDLESESCATPSYRLWSRQRKVSAETKAEFEKLAVNAPAEYYSWNSCPRLRSDFAADEYTLQQIEGSWFNIAEVHRGNRDKNTCITQYYEVDYENQKFYQTNSGNGPRGPVTNVSKGGITGSRMTLERTINGKNMALEFSAVSCNNGADLIVHLSELPTYRLMSRSRTASEEMLREFEKLSQYSVGAQYTVSSWDYCPQP